MATNDPFLHQQQTHAEMSDYNRIQLEEVSSRLEA